MRKFKKESTVLPFIHKVKNPYYKVFFEKFAVKQQQYQQVQYQYTLYKALKNKGDSNKYVIRQNIFYFYCWCPFFKYEHGPTNNAPV